MMGSALVGAAVRAAMGAALAFAAVSGAGQLNAEPIGSPAAGELVQAAHLRGAKGAVETDRSEEVEAVARVRARVFSEQVQAGGCTDSAFVEVHVEVAATQGNELLDGLLEHLLVADNGVAVDVPWGQMEEEGSVSGTVRISGEGGHSVAVASTDSGLSVEQVGGTFGFSIDRTPPVVSIEWDDEGEGQALFSASRTAVVTVEDDHLSQTPAQIDANGAAVGAWALSDDERTATASIRFEDDGAYELAVTATDMAGNESPTSSSGPFAIDTQAPRATVSFDARARAVGRIDWFDQPVTALVTVCDEHLDGDSLSIEAGPHATFVSGWSGDGGTRSCTVLFKPASDHGLSVSAADLAGNRSETSYPQGARDLDGSLSGAAFGVDVVAPAVRSASVSRQPVARLAVEGGEAWFYRGPVELTVELSDDNGISSAALSGDGYDTQAAIDGAALESRLRVAIEEGRDVTRGIVVRAADVAGNAREWSLAPSGSVRDWSGSATVNAALDGGRTHPMRLVVDSTAPVVRLSGPRAGSCLREPQAISLEVDERNLRWLREAEPGRVVARVACDGDVAVAGGGAAAELADLEETSEGLWTWSGLAASDGTYTVEAQVTDPAGWTGAASLGPFTIDTVAPMATIGFEDGQGAEGFFNAPRTAVVTVVERNFDPGLVSLETTGTVGAWESDGGVHRARVSFASDGEHRIAVWGTDLAGNALVRCSAGPFIIDTQAPLVEVDGVEGGGAYRGALAPTISVSDETAVDPERTGAEVRGVRHGTVKTDCGALMAEEGGTCGLDCFPADPEVDDVYIITAWATDKAGNETRVSKTFSVNRYGSNFIVPDPALWAAGRWLSAPRDVMVKEVSASGSESELSGVTVTRDGEVVELERTDGPADTGFWLETQGFADPDGDGWEVRTYRVPRGNFTADGRYHVEVHSTDRAGNSNTSAAFFDRETGNAAASAEVAFAVDATEPVVSAVSVKRGSSYQADPLTVTFDVVDNIGLERVEALVDGEQVEVASVGRGSYAVEVPARRGAARTLSIIAVDLAGNWARSEDGAPHGEGDPVSVTGFYVTQPAQPMSRRIVGAGVAVLAAGFATALCIGARLRAKPRRS